MKNSTALSGRSLELGVELGGEDLLGEMTKVGPVEGLDHLGAV